MPLLAVIANKTLWPIWALISLAGAMFPLLLCPVYVNFISRMGLAWSLDRQLPEWFGEVNERMAAPLNAILATLGLTAVFLWLQNFPVLPQSIAPPSGKLNLVATLWFWILMAALTWIMPGFNALLAPFRRTDLIRNAPWRAWPARLRPLVARVRAGDLLVGRPQAPLDTLERRRQAAPT